MAPATPYLTDSNASVESRIAATERLLRDQAARVRRSTLLTTIVGLILMLLMAGYFLYGYREISHLLKPETLANYAGVMLEDHAPAARRSLESEIQRSAPQWAASLSRQAQEALPRARTELEEYVLRQVDAKIDDTVELTEAQFRDFLRDNRSTLEQGFKDLATSPALAEESLNHVQMALEHRFKLSMQEGASDLFVTLHHWNSELARLKSGSGLSHEEQVYRQIGMLARQLQIQEADPGLAPASPRDAAQ